MNDISQKIQLITHLTDSQFLSTSYVCEVLLGIDLEKEKEKENLRRLNREIVTKIKEYYKHRENEQENFRN